MGMRFYRRISLGKLARLNISKSGIGLTLGFPGLRLTTGPTGTFFTLGLPGTGMSYRKKIGGESGFRWPDWRTLFAKEDSPKLLASEQATPLLAPQPDMPPTERRFVEGLVHYREGRLEAALEAFLNIASEEPGAAALAGAILAGTAGNAPTAARQLERIIQAEEEGEFPTPLMQKYLVDTEIQIDVTPTVSVTAPIDIITVSLLLVEMYQKQNKIDEALSLLEELDELTEGQIPLITLSLCELYALAGVWDGIIDRAHAVEAVTDDVTLQILNFHGRALQEKDLPEAAIATFTKALRRRKGLNPTLLHEARYWRARSYEQVGKKSRANQEYQRLFAEAPEFRDVAEKLDL